MPPLLGALENRARRPPPSCRAPTPPTLTVFHRFREINISLIYFAYYSNIPPSYYSRPPFPIPFSREVNLLLLLPPPPPPAFEIHPKVDFAPPATSSTSLFNFHRSQTSGIFSGAGLDTQLGRCFSNGGEGCLEKKGDRRYAGKVFEILRVIIGRG